MGKKIIAYALICMLYHGAYIATDFYHTNDTNSSYTNDTHTAGVFWHSNIMGSSTNRFNRATHFNEENHNRLTRTGSASLPLKELAKRKKFAKALYYLQLAGNMVRLKAWHDEITRDKNSYWIICKQKIANRRWRLEQIEKAMSDPTTRRLNTIKNGDLTAAMEALNEFPSLCSRNVTTTVPEGQVSQVFNESFLPEDFKEAKRLLTSRSDYQALIKSQQEQKAQPIAEGYRSLPIPEIPREMRSARALMLEALSQSMDKVQLAETIDGVRREVFDLARLHNYQIHSEVQDRVHTSIRIIRGTEHAHELVFHVAVVDRVLSDIQIQAAPEMAAQATLLERSPALLVHGLKTFVSALNPISQIKGLCELLVDTAHFACDMTVGKLYLSPQEYQARKDGFWETMDALSPENLAQLSAEHWVELAANMAAGVVVGGGIYKTVSYLREIEATSRAVRQAAKIAGALKGAVDTVLREHPILVTAEGVLISNYDKLEEVTEEVVAVVKNSQTLLECAARAADRIARRLQPLGLGPSRDARIIAENLHEQLVMEEIMANPLMGIPIKLGKGMTDPRWHKIDGWVKMAYYSHSIEIHYVAQWINGVMQAVDDFKFKY